MTIFNRIKETATKKGLSIERVADMATESGVKVSKSAIYDWKIHEPNPDKIKAVSDVLNVPVDYLLGNNDNPTPPTRRFVESGLSRADKLEDVTSVGADMSDAELEKVLDYMGLLKNARQED
ncbi:helix-turn-helix transcriptional regulator [Weissella coleopterorum]|uniref:Helix-turn-helix transcriptional regulator n=1 Tax=Weissella coleopterorum TaxID=2714949 RepID=A0A6G8AY92_9LACO|nr:helix-turn-helix transcriptional regulator [Weissella coleopterorum]QIL50071.1 helix-turn-helix transcriptional regulator [Weissella coleopterorum]